jgi:hypothetical protein
MIDESRAILDDILSRWHAHCRGYSVLDVVGVDPLFRDKICRSGWDSSDDILDAQINGKIMDAVEFQVGEMKEPHRSAIHVIARNLYAGNSVWSSPRLPIDPTARAVVMGEARQQITARLMACGVM